MLTVNSNMLSLFQVNEEMAKKSSLNLGSFSIGEFHIGFQGTKYYVWNSKWIKELLAKDFDAAKKEAYRKIREYCHMNKIAEPPMPT